ncbi:MAG: DUF3365 domain-containing protein [Gammaproteobacteria bacterium]|nr:DUF3365 domain-containing protein [Gammaproteobacteria bacterium]
MNAAREFDRRKTGGTRTPAYALSAAWLALGIHLAHAAPLPGDDVAVSRARTASIELGTKLKSQLETALGAGGAVSALEVCRTVAPAIAAEISARHAGDVGRTALRVRNPANAPDEFETAVLERFAAAAAAGADITTLEHAEILEQEGRRVLRYLKAIPMAAAPCGTCHGTDIDPGLRAEILARYPADAATGFVPGELRGAFTVEQTLP